MRLCDVDPQGRSGNFSDGYLRLDPAAATGEVRGTGVEPGTGTELRSCTHTIHHQPGAASLLILPITSS